MKYIFNELFIKDNYPLFIISVSLIILIILTLLFIGIKVIRKK